MKAIINALKSINYRLFFAILLLMLFPTVYQTVRIFFLGAMPNDWGFNIASQLSWVSLFYEIIQEALILPLFFILGKSLANKDDFINKIRSGLLLTGVIYFALSFILFVFAKPLVIFMAQDKQLIDATVDYVRLETIAALLSTLFKFMLTVLITMKKDGYMYLTLIIQMLLSVLLDTFLVSNLDFSLKIGVNGIAITNIIVNCVNLIICMLLLKRENMPVFTRRKLSFVWVKEWFQVGKYSGIESLIRNVVFSIMIIRMVNMVSEQGSYWVANNFIWNWLLLPALALGDLIKKETGEDKNNIQTKTFGYIVLTTIFAILWISSIPSWKPFLRIVMNIDVYETVYYIVLVQTVFYITFIFNNIFDSTFYGVGRTDYMLIQSICIDIFYYGIAFILYLNGIFVPSLLSVSLLFGIGMAADFIPTLILYFRMLKKMNMRIMIKGMIMKIFSIYKTMEESAELCPSGHNIKMLIRHSIRQEIKDGANIETIENAQLTREGKKMAERLGESLDMDIGAISSSYSQRCVDTCQEIIKGYNQNHSKYNHGILKTEMLQSPHCKNIPEQHDTWAKLGMNGVFDCFAKNIDMPGFYDLETSVKRIVDYIFEIGNKNNSLDIFCTHDFQIAMLLLFFNEKKYEYKQILFGGSDNWPFMLEGMFLWKDKSNLNVLWRGKKYII